MESGQIQASLLTILENSPITSASVVQDVRESVQAGEVSLAFDTLCSWLYEDSLPISHSFYERLISMSDELEEPRAVEKLDELVIGPVGSEDVINVMRVAQILEIGMQKGSLRHCSSCSWMGAPWYALCGVSPGRSG